jgi:hypothetical protein
MKKLLNIGMRSTRLFLIVLVASHGIAFCQDENQEGSPTTPVDRVPFIQNMAIGILPSALVAPAPRLRVSAQYRWTRWGAGLDAGYALYPGTDIRSTDDYQLYTLRPEVRYYFTGHLNAGILRQYFAIEGLYKYHTALMTAGDVTYTDEDGRLREDVNIERADYSSTEFAIGPKYGFEFKLSSHFFIDVYAGLALGSEAVSLDNVVEQSGFSLDLFDSGPDEVEGTRINVNLLYGVRFMYAFDL